KELVYSYVKVLHPVAPAGKGTRRISVGKIRISGESCWIERANDPVSSRFARIHTSIPDPIRTIPSAKSPSGVTRLTNSHRVPGNESRDSGNLPIPYYLISDALQAGSKLFTIAKG